MTSKFFQAIAICCLFTSLCSCVSQPSNQATLPRVKLEEVQQFSGLRKKFSGLVSADQFSYLAFKTPGTLISIPIEEGQKMTKNQIVAQLDPADFQLDLDAKSASYQTAQAQMIRFERLREKQAISQQDFEITRAQFENAKAAYEYSKTNLEETTLKAPFDGFVQQKFVENYQRVQAGQKIICLVNPDKLKMQATLPETLLSIVTTKPNVRVEFDAYRGIYFKGKIEDFIQYSADGSGIPIFVRIQDPKFSLSQYHIGVGFSCSIEILLNENSNQDWTLVSLSSVLALPEDKKGVYIYDNQTNTVKLREVQTGSIIDKDKVIITQGLAAHEKVVSAGVTRLRDGQIVKVLSH